MDTAAPRLTTGLSSDTFRIGTDIGPLIVGSQDWERTKGKIRAILINERSELGHAILLTKRKWKWGAKKEQEADPKEEQTLTSMLVRFFHADRVGRLWHTHNFWNKACGRTLNGPTAPTIRASRVAVVHARRTG
jgi:hypothetical protein